MSPQISIIMNCKNGEKFLKESINSIISQTFKNVRGRGVCGHAETSQSAIEKKDEHMQSGVPDLFICPPNSVRFHLTPNFNGFQWMNSKSWIPLILVSFFIDF